MLSRNRKMYLQTTHPLTKTRFLRYLGYASQGSQVVTYPHCGDANKFILLVDGHTAELQVTNGEAWVTTALGTRWWPVAKRTKGVSMGRQVHDYILEAGTLLAEQKKKADALARKKAQEAKQDAKISLLIGETMTRLGLPEDVVVFGVTPKGRVWLEFKKDFTPEEACEILESLAKRLISTPGV